MPRIGVLGCFPDRNYAESFLQALASPDLEVINCSTTDPLQDKSLMPGEALEQIADSNTALIIVVFSQDYVSQIRTRRRLEFELIVRTLQNSPNKIVPITYESSLELPGVLSSVQLLDIQKVTLAVFVERMRERLAAVVPSRVTLIAHPRIDTAIREAFSGKRLESVSGPVTMREPNVGYELFRIVDRDFGDLFLVHTYEPIIIRASAEHFHAHYGGVASDRLYLVASRDRAAPNPDVRLENLRHAFGASDAWYVDTFIADRLGWPPTSSVENIPDPKPYFVEPWVKSSVDGRNLHAIAYLDDWRRSGNSILVVQGPGGIGKTQLLRKFAKEVSRKDKVAVVYLDAQTVVDYARENVTVEFNLATLAKIIEKFADVGLVTRARLETLLSSDSFLLILDGMDEIIPRLPAGYKPANFFSSVQEVVEGLEGGRLLVSCRNSFWDAGTIDKPISVVDLVAFDHQQVDIYLENRFPNDASAKERSRRNINSMQEYFSRGIYPFILDLACRMSSPDHGPIADKPEDERLVFDDDEILDEVLWHVCRREAAKFGDDAGLGLEDRLLDVELQATFLTELALLLVGSSGKPETEVRNCLEAILRKSLSDAVFSAFKSHPLLETSGDIVRFSYDFIHEFFLARGVKQILLLKREIDSTNASILAGLCRLESNFLRTLARKVGPLTEEVTLGIAEFITTIKSGPPRAEWEREKWNSAVGGATNIGLQCFLLGKWDTEAATKYLVDLFGASGGLEIVDLVLFAPNSETRTIFSFENMIVRGAEIIDYDDFLRCKFNRHTQFISSVVYGGKFDLGLKTTATASNFDYSCAIDPRIREQIRARDDRSASIDSATEKYLKEFLRSFRRGGSYRIPRDPETLQNSFKFSAKRSFSNLMKVTVDCGLVVTNVGMGGKFVGINPAALNEVEDFVGQGLQGERVRKALREMHTE